MNEQELIGAMTTEEHYAYLNGELIIPVSIINTKQTNTIRMNKTFITTSKIDQILNNRLKKYKRQAVEWFQIVYIKPLNNEEGN